jgi:hypothetical protein
MISHEIYCFLDQFAGLRSGDGEFVFDGVIVFGEPAHFLLSPGQARIVEMIATKLPAT